MKVYVAASSREPARVRKAMLWLRDRGWTLTLDWLTEIEANLARGMRDKDLLPVEQARHAQAALDAIRESDVVWLLAPVTPSKGAYVELGYALGVGKPVVVSGGAPSIFCHLAAVIADTDEDGLRAVEMLGGQMRLHHARLSCSGCGARMTVTSDALLQGVESTMCSRCTYAPGRHGGPGL